jgi:hypothetical protein
MGLMASLTVIVAAPNPRRMRLDGEKNASDVQTRAAWAPSPPPWLLAIILA